MQGQHRNVNSAVENNILLQIVNSFGVRADARGILKRLQIGVEIQAGLLIKRNNLSASNGAIQLVAVIDSSVPGDVALCADFQLRAKRENERKVDLLIPQELVGFLASKIVRCGLR